MKLMSCYGYKIWEHKDLDWFTWFKKKNQTNKKNVPFRGFLYYHYWFLYIPQRPKSSFRIEKVDLPKVPTKNQNSLARSMMRSAARFSSVWLDNSQRSLCSLWCYIYHSHTNPTHINHFLEGRLLYRKCSGPPKILILKSNPQRWGYFEVELLGSD